MVFVGAPPLFDRELLGEGFRQGSEAPISFLVSTVASLLLCGLFQLVSLQIMEFSVSLDYRMQSEGA